MKELRIKNPVSFIPVIVFILYTYLYGMSQQAYHGAFELAGLIAIIIIGMEYKKGQILDRLMLGLNLYFFLGALGYLFSSERILEWYARSAGGPLFFCIAMVGLLATLFTKPGFVGRVQQDTHAQKYASFILLAASFVAWIWSVNGAQFGVLWAVVAPFFVLLLIREQLVQKIL